MVTTLGGGTSDSGDYEAYTYDANGDVLTDRRRSGDTISFVYDALSEFIDMIPIPQTFGGWSEPPN